MQRSTFLKTSLLALGATGLPRFSIGQTKAERRKLRIACIGVGVIGKGAVSSLASENIVAICDVDTPYVADVLKSQPQAKYFTDFRVMFEKMGNEIDAVTISTPDHAHFHIAMLAMSLGKHVYLEKPLAHKIEEIRLLQKRAKTAGVIDQMGNQGHSSEGIRLMKEWYDAGILGEVREVHAWTDTPYEPFFLKNIRTPAVPGPVPEGLDWDLWLGPLAERPFCPDYVRKFWRGWWEFGGGMIGDNSPHTLDAPFWALDLGEPERVEVELEGPPNAYYTPFVAKLVYHFPRRGALPPVKLHWYQGKPEAPEIANLPDGFELNPRGMLMVGSRQTVYSPGYLPESPRLVDGEAWNELRAHPVPKTIPRIKGGHYQGWLDHIRSGQPCSSNFAYGGALSELAVLGALAIRSGKSLDWDAAGMRVRNAPELNPFLHHQTRLGWDYRNV